MPTRDEIQKEMLRRLEALRVSGRSSGILQAPTGLGKTRCAAEWVKMGRARNARFLFLVHRDILIEQTEIEFASHGISFDVEQAARDARNPGTLFGDVEVVIASKDTMQGERLASWPKNRFTDIILDECHLATAKSWRSVLEHFDHSFLLGLSATPYRLDGEPLYGGKHTLFGPGKHREPYELEFSKKPIHEAFAFKYPLYAAVKHGHLARIIAGNMRCEVDLKGVRVSRSGLTDFNRGDLDAKISSMIEPLVNETAKRIDELGIKRAILYAPDVRSAVAFADAFKQLDVPSAAVWTGSKANPLPATQKRMILDAARDGQYRVLCSCDLLTMGYNDPYVDCVIIARPTRSYGLFYQMVGRATRILPDKRECYVLGYKWTGAEGVVSTLDLMLEDEPSADVREKAKRIAGSRKSDLVDVVDVIEEAIDEAEKEAKALQLSDIRVSVKRRETNFEFETFTPFNVGDMLGVQLVNDPVVAKASPITPKQKQFLKSHGMTKLGGLSSDDAARIIDNILDRSLYSFVNPEQIQKLVARGVPIEEARAMTVSQFSEIFGDVSPRLRSFMKLKGYTDAAIERMGQKRCAEIYRAYAIASRRRK